MTTVRSCESLLGTTVDGAAAAIVVAAVGACDVFAVGDATGPGVAGAVCPGRFVCGEGVGGFGPKNFAHSRITPTDSSDATSIRNSGVNLSFCPGKLTNAPHSGQRQSGGQESPPHLLRLTCFPISPEPGRIRIFARAVGSATAAVPPAKLRAPLRSVQSLRTHSANTSARIGSSPQTESISRLCSIAAQIVPRAQPRSAGFAGARYLEPLLVGLWRALQQSQQIRRQRGKLRARHGALRVYDDVPSCGYLQPVAAHHFAQTPPDTIAHHRAAKRLFDAEPKPAPRLFVGAEKNCEVGTRAALTGAVDGVKLRLSHQPRLARKRCPSRLRTGRSHGTPRFIRG